MQGLQGLQGLQSRAEYHGARPRSLTSLPAQRRAWRCRGRGRGLRVSSLLEPCASHALMRSASFAKAPTHAVPCSRKPSGFIPQPAFLEAARRSSPLCCLARPPSHHAPPLVPQTPRAEAGLPHWPTRRCRCADCALVMANFSPTSRCPRFCLHSRPP